MKKINSPKVARRGRPRFGRPVERRQITGAEAKALSFAGIKVPADAEVDGEGILWHQLPGGAGVERAQGGLFPALWSEGKAAAVLKAYWAYLDRSAEPLSLLARVAATRVLCVELSKRGEGLDAEGRVILDDMAQILGAAS